MVSEHTVSSWEFHTLFSLENRKVTNYRNGCGGKREYVLAAILGMEVDAQECIHSQLCWQNGQ